MKNYPVALLLPALIAAAPSTCSKGHYSCTTFTVPVTVADVKTLVVPFPPFANQYEATSVANMVTDRYQAPTTPTFKNLTATYQIAAEYCWPTNSTPSSTLQILTHGLGFNRSYWEFQLPSTPGDHQYNYIYSATALGYSTLSYNRLGIPPSSMPDSYTEIQSPVELAILAELTKIAKAGKLPIPNQVVNAPKSIIHVGHSYGSILTLGLAATAPTLTSGIVLTGFSNIYTYNAFYVATTTLQIAPLASPAAFPPSLYTDTGYLTWPSVSNNQYAFFANPYTFFNPAVLEYTESTKQTYTIGESLTLASTPANATGFTGPVLYVNGEADLIFCDSNCTGLVQGPNTPAIQAVSTSNHRGLVDSVIVKGFGHALNVHLNASGKVYAVIGEWAKKNGF